MFYLATKTLNKAVKKLLTICAVTVALNANAQMPQLLTNFPQTNGNVLTIVKDTITHLLYIGGNFTQVGDSTRNRIACIDSTGKVTACNPNADGQVWTLSVLGNKVYAGGNFTNIGGVNRMRIAALDVNTGNATSWSPNAQGIIYTLVVSGNTVYTGGNSNNKLVAFDITTGNKTSWNPNPDGDVYTLAIAGNTIYAGGAFATIGGQTRKYIAALDTSIGNVTSWNPILNRTVKTLTISGNRVYVGGEFDRVGNPKITRNGMVALDTNTGIATVWDADVTNSNTTYTLAVSGNKVYAGGTFTSIGWNYFYTRNRIAAFDIDSGFVTSFNPNANNSVYVILLSGDRLYVGGQFSAIDGQNKNNFAVFQSNSFLPVKLQNFTAQKLNENKVGLNWQAASETNNSHFEIERSVDGASFAKIGVVRGAGNSSIAKQYSFTDNAAVAEHSQIPALYYRLKQIDFDGTFEYSNVVVINLGTSATPSNQVVVFPNPATNEISIKGLPASGAKITDITGKILLQIHQDGTYNVSELKSGMYFIVNEERTVKLILE